MTPNGPITIGSRRELLVDDYLIERMTGAELRLHQPVPREVALVTDQPWEGNMCGYITVFQDGDRYRMYYKAWHVELAHPESQGERLYSRGLWIACAESRDGIRWERPEVGLYEVDGSRANNVVWTGEGSHGFAPFKDTNPACPEEARYKAVGAGRHAHGREALYAFQSPDGIHWAPMSEEPIITQGRFDSQNLAFWDAERSEYRAYIRDFNDRIRGIKTAVSPDFIHWTDPVWLDYPGAPVEQLYTNQILPYYRAPHLFVGFPTRYVERQWSPAVEGLPEEEHRKLRAGVKERFGAAVTDGLFMSSRDGVAFKRWGEAFLRPGLREEGNWTYGDNYQSWGLVETASAIAGAPRELSLYSTEGYWRGNSTTFRRYTLRIDGFVSLQAPLRGGEMVTKPLIFAGGRLELNISTSAAGSARVEVQDAGGTPIPGFTLDDCYEIIGDTLAYTVRWRDGSDVARLAGRPARLRFVMHDADLYSFGFTE